MALEHDGTSQAKGPLFWINTVQNNSKPLLAAREIKVLQKALFHLNEVL
jgi:hypothetical protein